MPDNATPMPGRRHIMDWDDYDAACEWLDKSIARRRAVGKFAKNRECVT